MTTFGWKRKAGQSVEHQVSTAFERDAKDDELDNEVTRGEVDWLTLAPKRRLISLEDARAKSNRLRDEGATLADAERYWEAIKKWDEALLVLPSDSKVLEMKAQALMALGEVFPAVQAALQAVNAEPTWWAAQQTLGRAQLNLGEVKMAIRSFCKAIMLNPADREMWDDDLMWACSIRDRQTSTQGACKQNVKRTTASNNSSIVTSKDLAERAEQESEEKTEQERVDETETSSTEFPHREETEEDENRKSARTSVLNVPANFVHLRG